MAARIVRGLAIERGSDVELNGTRLAISHVLDLDFVMAQDPTAGKIDRVAIAQLKPAIATVLQQPVADLTQLDGEDLGEARRRLASVKELLALPLE